MVIYYGSLYVQSDMLLYNGKQPCLACSAEIIISLQSKIDNREHKSKHWLTTSFLRLFLYLEVLSFGIRVLSLLYVPLVLLTAN